VVRKHDLRVKIEFQSQNSGGVFVQEL